MEDNELEKLIEDTDIETLDFALWTIRERNKLNQQTEDKKNEPAGVVESGSVGRIHRDAEVDKEAIDASSETLGDA